MRPEFGRGHQHVRIRTPFIRQRMRPEFGPGYVGERQRERVGFLHHRNAVELVVLLQVVSAGQQISRSQVRLLSTLLFSLSDRRFH